jgi:hypothetical protein
VLAASIVPSRQAENALGFIIGEKFDDKFKASMPPVACKEAFHPFFHLRMIPFFTGRCPVLRDFALSGNVINWSYAAVPVIKPDADYSVLVGIPSGCYVYRN